MLKFKKELPFVEDTSLHDIIKVCETPFYVYSQEMITNKVKMTKKILGKNIFFSVKANSNQAILKLMNSLEIGADVVSIGELKRSLSAGFSPSKIIFEGVGKSKEDLIYAIQKNIRLINTESLEEIKLLQKLASEKNKLVDIGIRLNPNIDGGTISKISTGKKTDKFGIEINEIENIVNLVSNCDNLNLIGISCHIGSQISSIDAYKNTFIEMKKAADKFLASGINIQHVDLGGGFHVSYNKNDPIFRIEDVKSELDACFNAPVYELSFEPGRYLIADAGVLVTSIINTKQNGGVNYLIVDAGMNTLIRPAMYNAHHDIETISKNTDNSITYTVAGPICESTDIFVKNILLSKQNIGDILIIKNTGAYGKVMSSNYNTRPLPTEVLVNKENFAMVYIPEKIEKSIEEDIIPSWL
tara:strand:+ start:1563 stop:2804 length:1242 start_codon:yes stop_codon:yes gene_type:complete